MTTISIQPKQLDLNLYAGDGFGLVLNFVVKSTSEPWDASGTWQASIRDAFGTVITDFHIDTNQASTGKIYLSLTGDQTNLFSSGVWDLQQLPGPRTWYRGCINTTKDVTRP
jgi:hypothetical protein